MLALDCFLPGSRTSVPALIYACGVTRVWLPDQVQPRVPKSWSGRAPAEPAPRGKPKQGAVVTGVRACTATEEGLWRGDTLRDRLQSLWGVEGLFYVEGGGSKY